MNSRPLRIEILTVALAVTALCGCTRSDPLGKIARIEERRDASSAELIELLRSGSTAVRSRAALAMGRIQSADYAEPLARAARDDEDLATRRAALFALGQLGLMEGARPPGIAVSLCAEMLHDVRPELVADAAEALGKLAPDEAASRLVALLDHSAVEVRAAAVQALFRLRFVPVWRHQTEEPPPLPAAATAAIARTLLEDPATAPRRLAAHAFSRWGEPAAVAELARALDDEDEWVRTFAARALGRSDARGSVAPLLDRVEDPSPAVRTESVVALARLDQADRLPLALGEDPSHHVRAAFAAALAAGRAEAGLDALRAMFEDTTPTVAGAALQALVRRVGLDAGSLIDRAAADPRWPVRAAAVRSAGTLGEAGLPWLDRADEDDHNAVRVESLRARAASNRGLVAVAAALSSTDLALRGTAVELLVGLDVPGKAALLIETYERSPGIEWVEVRESIVDALADLAEGAPSLETIAVEDEAPSVRRKARARLERLGLAPPALGTPSREGRPSELLGRTFARDPVVVLETEKGTIEILCLAREAPIHVASFVELVRSGHYDGLIWHRVVSNFVIQGGDPRGDGWGGAGYLLRDEINRVPFERGTVGMPKAGKDTGGGQIFVTHLPTPHLDGNYTVFGRVVTGLDVVDRIEIGDHILSARLRGD